MSARNAQMTAEELTMSQIEASSADMQLGEGASYCVASPDNPLKRNLVVSIKASLNALCLQKSKGLWSPSVESLKSVFQQRKFTSLEGAAENQGDLKSVVLHDMNVNHVVSTFPIALGAKISAVDDCTFTSTGEPFSMVVLVSVFALELFVLMCEN